MQHDRRARAVAEEPVRGHTVPSSPLCLDRRLEPEGSESIGAPRAGLSALAFSTHYVEDILGSRQDRVGGSGQAQGEG